MRSNRMFFSLGLAVALVTGVTRSGASTSLSAPMAPRLVGTLQLLDLAGCCRENQKGNDGDDSEKAGDENGSVQGDNGNVGGNDQNVGGEDGNSGHDDGNGASEGGSNND